MKTSISSSLIVLAALAMSVIPIHADETQLTNIEFTYWKQGTSITSSENGYALSTVGLSDGYYTTTLTNERVRDFTDIAGMKIELTVADDDVRVNLILGIEPAIRFEDGSSMIAVDETTGEIHRLIASFGTFTVPAHFSGTLYFPFDSLKSVVGKIDYWGLTVVQEEETVVEFMFTSASILDDEDDDEYQGYLNDEFVTPPSIQIPVVGESIAILKGPNEGEYALVSKTQGITIENNRFILTTEAVKGSIDYRFIYPNGKFVAFSSNLVQSWIIGVEDKGVPIALPVQGINIIQRYGILIENSFMHALRLGIGIIALFFLIFYRFIRRKGGN